ncbi:MAG: hypothetical protein NZ921_01515 [Candidatus Caldarchaeum sp.]|nr:hypothetical protein [Candidatus Caldarchaeum sp.]
MNLLLRYRVESALQLMIFSAAGFSMVGALPAELLLFYAFFSFLFAVFGFGWPFAVPCGKVLGGGWLSGALMTVLCFSLAFSTHFLSRFFMNNIVTHAAIFILWLVFVWGLAFSSWPLFHTTPKQSIIVSGLTTISLAHALAFLTSSIITASSLTQLSITHIALVSVLSPYFVLQGYPFVSFWRQPRIGAAITFSSLALALTVNGLLPAEYMEAFFSSLALWSILHSWAFVYPLSLKHRQPIRGVLGLPVVIVSAFLWTLLSSFFNTQSSVNLLVILPALVTHNIFWLRKPFLPPLLVGMPPPGHTDAEKLFEWPLQLRPPLKS